MVLVGGYILKLEYIFRFSDGADQRTESKGQVFGCIKAACWGIDSEIQIFRCNDGTC